MRIYESTFKGSFLLPRNEPEHFTDENARINLSRVLIGMKDDDGDRCIDALDGKIEQGQHGFACRVSAASLATQVVRIVDERIDIYKSVRVVRGIWRSGSRNIIFRRFFYSQNAGLIVVQISGKLEEVKR